MFRTPSIGQFHQGNFPEITQWTLTDPSEAVLGSTLSPLGDEAHGGVHLLVFRFQAHHPQPRRLGVGGRPTAGDGRQRQRKKGGIGDVGELDQGLLGIARRKILEGLEKYPRLWSGLGG